MIIKQTRIKSGGSNNVIAHVNKMGDNEVCEFLFGCEDSLRDADDMAQQEDRKYAIRHFMLSPGENVTDDQIKQMIEMVGKEFDFKDRDVAVWKHVKERADESTPPHFHILVSEQNYDGKVMSNRMNYVRNEKLARAMELRFGHELTKGAHNKAVHEVAKKSANPMVADKLLSLTEGPRPVSAFSTKAHRKAERLGVDLPKIAHELKGLQKLNNIEKGQALSALERKYNVNFQKGDRRNVILIKKEGELITNANKGLKIEGKDVSEILSAKASSPDSSVEIGDRRGVEGDREHRSDVRAGATNEVLSVRSGRPAEQRRGSKSTGSNTDADRAVGANKPESDRHDGSYQQQHREAGRSNRAVQLNDSGAARSRLKQTQLRGAAQKSSQRMKFGNLEASRISTDAAPVPTVMPYGADADALLRAWAAGMQASAPRM